MDFSCFTNFMDIKIISTDVFDTLLYRTAMSERSRILAAETRFSSLLKRHGWSVDVALLMRTRFEAQKMAYRALNIATSPTELRLVDIISRQFHLLGLPQTLISQRVAIEVEVERSALYANVDLASWLWKKKLGVRIIAISDTAFSSEELSTLIEYFHGKGLIDEVYSSADLGATKRFGELFTRVLEAEGALPGQMLHIGDDDIADKKMPSLKGIVCAHFPRSRLHRRISRLNGVATVAYLQLRQGIKERNRHLPLSNDQFSFGRQVFGPIVSVFCLLIWLYAKQAGQDSNAVLLFCARGGIGIREAFERILSRLDLPLDTRRENLLISRLVAARSALLADSQAARDELRGEFRHDTYAKVASALGGRNYDLSKLWDAKFDASKFNAMLRAVDGVQVLSDIQAQNSLFVRHLEQITGAADRLILCDTGLYGSTQRLLSAGFADKQFETIQFARCNYKGYSEEHFSKVYGLMVESNIYNPIRIESVVLRYWQIIEHLFEPKVSSVRTFSQTDANDIVANTGDIRHGFFDPAHGNDLLAGVLSYIDALTYGGQAFKDADVAWGRLRQAITNPTSTDLAVLGLGSRSIDFGRDEKVEVITLPEQHMSKVRWLMSIKGQLWREGAISHGFPRFKHVLLPILSTGHSMRAMWCTAFGSRREGALPAQDGRPATLRAELPPPKIVQQAAKARLTAGNHPSSEASRNRKPDGITYHSVVK